MQTRESEFELELEEESELEEELEGEYEEEFELEGEFEGEGEFEYESELEFEGEYEGEFEGEYEYESELEGEYEYEGEFEGEEFIRRLGRLARRAAPVLRRVARVAAPIVGTAIGGPVGGMIARTAARALLEAELEGEYEGEFEEEYEAELEAELMAPPTRSQAAADVMAAAASRVQREAEAEALIGAATVNALTPRDRRQLQALLPHLVHGTAVLTRILRRYPATRPAVRTIPQIVQRTGSVLSRQAAAGRPVTPRVAGRVMARQVRRVLSNPATTARAMARTARSSRALARPVRGTGMASRRPVYGRPGAGALRARPGLAGGYRSAAPRYARSAGGRLPAAAVRRPTGLR
jgi:hypothetical protein